MNVGDETQVSTRKTKAQLKQEERKEWLKKVFSDRPTRAWVYEILEQCHAFRSISSPEPHSMAIMSGRRDIGLHIIADIMTTDPTIWTKMIEENNG